MRVALYVRVSTERQVEQGHSIDAQKDRLMDYVKSQGWEIADFYIDDGYSAKDLNRPQMQRLLKDASEKKFDVILVYRLDRLVRSVLDLHYVLKQIDKHEVMFKSATEMFDTTSAMGRFFITLVGAMAEWERSNLGERVKMGMEKNFLKGGFNGGLVPYGYRMEEGKLLIHETEMTIVRKIFSEYKEKGFGKIAKDLNWSNIPSRSGNPWTLHTVRYILENPVYSGRLKWNDIIVESDHERIISPEEQDTLMNMKISRQRGRNDDIAPYPYSSVLVCNRCGSKLYGSTRKRKNKNRYRHYRCSGRINGNECDLPIIGEDTVERHLLHELQLMIDEKWKKDVGTKDEKPDTDFERMEKELKDIEQRKKKWQLAFANDVIDIDDLKARMNEEREKEDMIQRALEEADHTPETTLTREEVIEFAKILVDKWDLLEYEHRKQFIHGLFKEIKIDTVKKNTGGPGTRAEIKIISVETN
jgi:site-specific DNA recombinase